LLQKCFEDGSRDISDLPGSDQPRITIEYDKQKVDVLITLDQRVTIREIIVQLGIGHSAMQEMIKTLEYWKISLTADRLAQKGMHGCSITVASMCFQRQ
jgi:hypothetical protein